MYVPTLTFGELWAGSKTMRLWKQAARMNFRYRVAGLSFRERVRISDIRRELRVQPLLLHVKRRQLRWFGHLIRTPPGWAVSDLTRTLNTILPIMEPPYMTSHSYLTLQCNDYNPPSI